ncbi:MAG: hypothetical protein CVV39_06895 [Planctomycetes bacterium HGW-Planctomycetes-1]|nr:MAG: hypothetical protein CVV39_06895 [Planctomycetes bacterium HGW-Planctomycetes-1]
MFENLIVELGAFFIFGAIAVSCLLFWETLEKKAGKAWSWVIVPPIIFVTIILLILILCRLFPNM